jgi:hypothetical protein
VPFSGMSPKVIFCSRLPHNPADLRFRKAARDWATRPAQAQEEGAIWPCFGPGLATCSLAPGVMACFDPQSPV